ncbi:hypothetical protein C3L33_03213, partial [Rhododendron williamsianum]
METSVFQKAKAKAKKVKDTIRTKTGHGPGVDNTNQNDQGHDKEDEQMVEHSEVPDTGPKYDSPAVTSTVAGQKKPDDKLGKPDGSKYTDAQTRPSSQWPDENTGNRGHLGDPKISSEKPAAMEEDPYTPNDQSKVADPTGTVGEEAGIGSILNSFNKLNVNDGKPESKPISERAPETYTESQDHFSQEPIPPTSTINPDDPGSISKSFDGDKPEDAPLDNVTNYHQTKAATPRRSHMPIRQLQLRILSLRSWDTAVPKIPLHHRKLLKEEKRLETGDDNRVFQQSERRLRRTRIETNLRTGTRNVHRKPRSLLTEPIPPTSTINPDDPGSNLKSFDGDKPKDAPLDNVTNLPSNQSSYAQKIPYADKAIAAKNVVALKLGYGSTEDPTASPKATQGGEEIGKPGTQQWQDQGVPVKKGYLAEKLRPSDDDKLLSENISDALHNRKQEVDGEEEGENQKPAVGKVTESEEVRERLGSEEGNRGVTETESKAAPNVSPTGKGMVESVKGTVTSWFSKGGDQKQNTEASPGTIPEEERLSSSTGEEAVGHGQSGVGEGRLQGSGN